MILDIVIEAHKDIFGQVPVFDDAHRRDPEMMIELIMNAIAKNKPYNELEQYSEEEEEN